MDLLSQTVMSFIGLAVFQYTVNGLILFTSCLVVDRSRGKITTNALKTFLFESALMTPVTSLLDLPVIMLHLNSYSQLNFNYNFTTLIAYFIFVETGVYWIHRLQHQLKGTIMYRVHLQHHRNYKPTVLDAFDSHPIDNFLRTLPVHVFPFLIPTHVYFYVMMYICYIIWNVLIHDGIKFSCYGIINDTQQHNYHHSHITCNYGMYTMFWDNLMGTSFQKRVL
jgi:Delta7-sterol 5-desaturase